MCAGESAGEKEMEIEKEMLEPRGGLWSSGGSVSDREWNNQRSSSSSGCGSGGGSGRGGEVMVVVR